MSNPFDKDFDGIRAAIFDRFKHGSDPFRTV
jgi:hypothetical protein